MGYRRILLARIAFHTRRAWDAACHEQWAREAKVAVFMVLSSMELNDDVTNQIHG